MHDGNCLSTLLDEYLASIKSITKNRFIPMMQRYVSYHEFFADINPNLVYALSRLVTWTIMGHAGNFSKGWNDDDDEQEVDDENPNKDVRTFADKIRGLVKRLQKNKQLKKLSGIDERVVEVLKTKSVCQLRAMFLPGYFQSLVTDDKKRHGWKATIFPSQIFLVLRFFSNVNAMSKQREVPDEKLQSLVPGPNADASYVQITNTASFVTFWLY